MNVAAVVACDNQIAVIRERTAIRGAIAGECGKNLPSSQFPHLQRRVPGSGDCQLPSPLTATPQTKPVWPRRVRSSRPLSTPPP